jgi:dimethylargininase
MRALTREVPDSFANALCARAPAVPIDIVTARAQHAVYRSTLASLGIDVKTLPPEHALADSCFVEDTAVVVNGVALITRPGAPSRQAEPVRVAEAFAKLERVYMQAPATLDGGDCMRVGDRIYVGRSGRTNEAGITELQRVFGNVVVIDMPRHVLHLKCVCAPLGNDRITLADDTIPASSFGSVDIVRVPGDEAYAANVLAVGSSVLVAAGFPRTRDAIADAGFSPIEMHTSEFRKADGALTCLSIMY